MSHGTRMTDAERTAIMLDLLHEREHGEQNGELPPSCVVLEEVAPGTGWSGGNRWADALVLGMWRSQGQSLDGYEVKASRADLKREIADPNKHRAVARYCDTWTLLIWSEAMLVDGLPEWWGITVVEKDEDGDDYSLRVVRKATKREPEPWPRAFVCSLVRNAHQQSPRARWVARVVERARAEAYRQGVEQGKQTVREMLHPIVKPLRGPKVSEWLHSSSDVQRLVSDVVTELTQRAVFPAPTLSTGTHS